MTDPVVPPPLEPGLDPKTPADMSHPPRWYGVGIADLMLVLLIAGIGQSLTRAMICDPGLGWHLRTPDYIVEHGWPHQDPFSGPSHGNAWLANQWLGDFPLWLGWKGAGLNGIGAVTIGLLLVGYRLLYKYLRDDGVPWPAAACWVILAALASYYAWMARPNLVTFLGVTILARMLTLFHEGRITPRSLAWLVPLFLLWANAHGGFVIGLAMIALAAMVDLVLAVVQTDQVTRSVIRKRILTLGLLGVACGLATLINPYGWKLYPWIYSLLGNTYFMNLNQEWLSPDFHPKESMRFGILILAFPALFAVSRHRPNFVLLAFSILWLYLALQGRRYVPLFAMVITPLLARASLEISWLNTRYSQLDLRTFFQTRSSGWIGLILALIGLGIWAKFSPPLPHNRATSPAEGLQYLLKERQPGERIFHGPNFGGFLTWYGWPELRVWIDDRNEVHGEEAYEAYFAIERTKPGWLDALQATEAVWVVVPPHMTLAYRLSEMPQEWQERFRDQHVVIYRKLGE